MEPHIVAPDEVADDRLLAPTRFVARAVVPVLAAAFVILYLLPDHTMTLWSWMVCPHMSAFVLGGGYLSGAYFFTRTSAAHEWHRVSVGFVATSVFSTMLLIVTVLHWDVFTHDHVSFWAWLLLYVATPFLLPVLWLKNRRTDPRRLAVADVRIPRPLRIAVGVGGGLQLGLALAMLLRPQAAADVWPWVVDGPTLRAMSAFVAFPAVTWLWFLVEDRWSCFRITQQTATLGLALLLLGALRAQGEFRSAGWFLVYLVSVTVALALNVALYGVMELRRHVTRSLSDAVASAAKMSISANS